MIGLDEILGIQPKTQLKYDKKERYPYFEKAPPIDYSSMEPFDECHLISTLTELKRLTRISWLSYENQYMPGSWAYGGFGAEEVQQNLDEIIYEQQLTQRVGRGILTQTPPLEWVSLQEASDIYGVNYKVVNRWIREGKLQVLQHKKGHRKLIYLDKSFILVGACFLKGSIEDNYQRVWARIRILFFEAKTGRYRRWKLPPSNIERNYTKLYMGKFIRSQLVRNINNSQNYQLKQSVHEGELKKYPTPSIPEDVYYYNALRSRFKVIHLGRPSLRYFTTEEAAFYLRLSKQAIIKAVATGRLTPMKTDTGKHFIFEKKTLLAFIGPSTNPIHLDEQSIQTLTWVEKNFASEFSGIIPPTSQARSFFTEREILFETWYIKKSFNKLCSVSPTFRAENLHYYNMIFHPEANQYPRPNALRKIARYQPPPKKRYPRKNEKKAPEGVRS